MNGITSIKARVRVHTNKSIDPLDNTHKVYDPAALKAAGVPGIDTTRVGAWVDYPLTRRDLKPVINGVSWQPAYLPVMAKDGSGNVTWESGTNRTSTTPATGSVTLNDTWK